MYGHMWPFGTRKERSAAVDDTGTLGRRLDDLESGFRRLRGEWEDWHEKMLRLAGRITKRAEREAGLSDERAPRVDGSALSPVQQQILKRRGAHGGPGQGE